jgi:hypothetical protein
MTGAIRIHALSPRHAFPPEGTSFGDACLSVPAAAADAIVVNADFNRTVCANLAAALSEREVRLGLDGGAALVFDGSREGRAFDAGVVQDLHAQLEAAAVSARRCVFLTQNTAFAEPYAAWCAAGQRPGFAVLVMHAHLRGLAMRAAAAPSQPCGWADGNDRRFLCLNRRMTPHRVVVLGYLEAKNMLARGLVSALGAAPEPLVPGRWEARFPAEIAAFQTFAGRLPLTLPETQREGLVFGWEPDWYRASAFSLVTETDCDAVGVRRFTEKSLKPLMAGHPMLLVGLPGTLALLRGYGFRTFDPLIREAYDAVQDVTERLHAVLAEFERLMAMPAAALRDLIGSLRAIVAHNAAWFRHGLRARLVAEDEAVRAAIRVAAGCR